MAVRWFRELPLYADCALSSKTSRFINPSSIVSWTASCRLAKSNSECDGYMDERPPDKMSSTKPVTCSH